MKKYHYTVAPSTYTKEYYLDDVYAGSQQFKEGLHRLVATIDRIFRKIPATTDHKRILDAGCGKGELLLFMKRKGYEVYGIDYSPQSIKIAKELMKRFRIPAVIKRRDVRDTSFPQATFDYVISSDVIEHLDDNDAVVDFFNESFRILKKGGTLYVHTAPNAIYVDYVQTYYMRFINYIYANILNSVFRKHISVSLDVRSTYDKTFHINEQTYESLSKNIQKSKFKKYSIELFGDPFEFNLLKLPFYVIAYFYPLNKLFPFSLLLANHIYLTAEK